VATAIIEAAHGGRPALLFHGGVAANRPISFSEDLLKAASMVAVDILCAGSVSLAEASGIVAAELTTLGRPVDRRKVLSWRKNFGRASDFAQQCRADLRQDSCRQAAVADRAEATRRAQQLLRVHVKIGA